MTLRLSIILLLGSSALMAETPSQRVGLPLVITEIYIPGGEVRAKPRRDSEPSLSVRIMEVKPAENGSRYDFRDPRARSRQLRSRGISRSPGRNIHSPHSFENHRRLPPGIPKLHETDRGILPELGGYRRTMTILGAIWLAGLLAILFWRKKKQADSGEDKITPPTLSERLRPLVLHAAEGKLPSTDRAKLKPLRHRALAWAAPGDRRTFPAEAMVALRSDPKPHLLFSLSKAGYTREIPSLPSCKSQNFWLPTNELRSSMADCFSRRSPRAGGLPMVTRPAEKPPPFRSSAIATRTSVRSFPQGRRSTATAFTRRRHLSS